MSTALLQLIEPWNSVSNMNILSIAPELGNLSLYLLLVTSLLMLCNRLLNIRLSYLKVLSLSCFASTFFAFLFLIYCFANSDFSVLLVANHSHTAKPMIYRIAAAWGNHEGSMILWLVSTAFFSFLYCIFSKSPYQSLSLTLSVQGLVIFLFTLFVLFTSNPFQRIFPAPLNGLGLNPLLQDIGLAFHPPMLYLGYVGFSIPFSSAFAALILNKYEKNWANHMQPWILLSWSFLTLGIGLGSWWAYRELGWGGFWFWDPVENASLMPWLTSTALLHSLKLTRHVQGFSTWSILLAIITFTLSMVGTFLVRSGIVTSVHSFAVDSQKGIFILAILTILSGSALMLYAVRALKKTNASTRHPLFSKPMLIILNNVMFIFITSAVLVGTLYPLVYELIFKQPLTVGAPYFNSLLAPSAAILLILCILSNHSTWIKINFRKAFYSIDFLLTIIAGVAIFYLYRPPAFSISFIIFIAGIWLVINNIRQLFTKFKLVKGGMLLSHMGFGILACAIAASSLFQSETQKILNVGDEIKIENITLKIANLEYIKMQNYYARIATFEAFTTRKFLAFLKPETRLYFIEKRQTTEAAIYRSIFYDLYLTIAENIDNNGVLVRASFKPGIGFIWFGCLLMCLGGLYTLLTVSNKRQNI